MRFRIFTCVALIGAFVLVGCVDDDSYGDDLAPELAEELGELRWAAHSPLAGSPDWPSAGHDWAHTGHNRAERGIGVDTVAGLEVVWQHEFSPAPGVLVPVAAVSVVGDGIVYIADAGGFAHARRVDDGELLWTSLVSTAAPEPFIGAVVQGGPMVTRSALYVGDSDATVHKVDRASGAVLWSTQVDAHPNALIQGDLASIGPYVVFGVSSFENAAPAGDLTMRGSVVALRKHDGSIAWQTFTTSDQSLSNPKYGAGVGVWSSPAIDPWRARMYIGTGQFYEPGAAVPDPASAADQDYSDSLLSISLLTGKIVNHRQFTSGDIFGQQYPDGLDADVGVPPNLFHAWTGNRYPVPAVGVGDKTGTYYAMDRRTLDILWQRDVVDGSVIGGFQSTAAYANGILYVAAHERIDGQSLNASIPPGESFTFLSTEAGTLLIQRGSRTELLALDASTGELLWQNTSYGGATFAPIVVANGVVFHGDLSGKLRALDALTGAQLFSTQIGGVPDGAGGIVFGNLISGMSLARGRLLVSYSPIVPGAPNGVTAFGLP